MRTLYMGNFYIILMSVLAGLQNQISYMGKLNIWETLHILQSISSHTDKINSVDYFRTTLPPIW
jgi:hypothetical protein